jgi:pimeloyl-ACP methyl ester carboxylesterase
VKSRFLNPRQIIHGKKRRLKMARYTIKDKNTVGWQVVSRLRLVILMLTILALFSTTSMANTEPGLTMVDGMTDGGAYYLIAVPPIWNGDLVIWNHGFTLDPPGPLSMEDLGPLAPYQLAEGYAVAASSFQQTGWALFKTKNDLQNMVGEFKDQFGKPNQVIVTGGSLGGAVTAQAIEKAHLGNVVGAYILCGAVAGSRNWDGALDLRLIYDVVAANTPDAHIPGGAEGLPEGSPLTDADIMLLVNDATGILLEPGLRTPQQSANLATILSETKIPANFLITDMLYATQNMNDLVHDTHKLKSKLGTGNTDVDYGDTVINENIARVSPHPGAENRLERYFTPSGDVGDTKIISIHTDKDGLVIVENESEYASVVPAENLTVAIVVEKIPSHCEFTTAEAIAGWESLRVWVAGGPQPSAEQIQATCLALESPAFPGPCRIDPTFVVPSMDERIRPR